MTASWNVSYSHILCTASHSDSGKLPLHRFVHKKTPVREIFPDKRGSSVSPNIN